MPDMLSGRAGTSAKSMHPDIREPPQTPKCPHLKAPQEAVIPKLPEFLGLNMFYNSLGQHMLQTTSKVILDGFGRPR